MSNIKRVGIVLLVVAVVAVFMASFKGSNILDRSIILGLGIDGSEEEITLTAEVVSPGNGSDQVGTFSKTVTAKGKSIGEAIQNLAQLTGKEASLGQCVVLVLGQTYFEQQDFTSVTDYFINHHSLKESTLICCCEGTAESLLNNGNALSQSISLSIATLLLDEAEKVAVVTNNLLEYARSQNELHCTGFLNKITFVPSENEDSQEPDKTQGFFTYKEIAVFRKNVHVCTLTEQDVMGLALFFEDVTGDSYISNVEEHILTLRVNNKSIDVKLTEDGDVEIKIKLSVRLGRTDSEEVSGPITAKKDKEINPKVLDDVQRQALELAQKYVDKQAELNFDLIKLHELYRKKHGTSDALAAKPTADFPVKLTVTVEEN